MCRTPPSLTPNPPPQTLGWGLDELTALTPTHIDALVAHAVPLPEGLDPAVDHELTPELYVQLYLALGGAARADFQWQPVAQSSTLSYAGLALAVVTVVGVVCRAPFNNSAPFGGGEGCIRRGRRGSPRSG